MSLFVGNRALLDAYRRGERHALAAVYDAYARQVVDLVTCGFQFESAGRVSRFAGFSDPLEVENCVQEVFLAVFSAGARHNYDGLRPFAPYVLQIARHRVIDELRRRRNALARMVGPLEEEPGQPAPDPSPEEQLDRAQATRLVSQFLAGCSAQEQRYVSLRFANNEPLTQAARQLNLTRMGARWLEQRLLRRLATHLTSAGYLGRGELTALLHLVAI